MSSWQLVFRSLRLYSVDSADTDSPTVSPLLRRLGVTTASGGFEQDPSAYKVGPFTYAMTDEELTAMISLSNVRPAAIRLQTSIPESLSRFRHMSHETVCSIAGILQRQIYRDAIDYRERKKTLTECDARIVNGDAVLVELSGSYSGYFAAYAVLWGQVFAVNGFAKEVSPAVEYAPVGIDFENIRLAALADG